MSGSPKYNSFLVSHPVEPHPTDQSSLDLHKSLKLNIASYFINTLAGGRAVGTQGGGHQGVAGGGAARRVGGGPDKGLVC